MNKILCIDDHCWIQACPSYVRKLDITIGRSYSVIEQTDSHYYIYNDKNYKAYYPEHCFKISDEIDDPKNLEILNQKAFDEAQQYNEEQQRLNKEKAIKQAMDRYYDPDAFYKQQARHDAFVKAISSVFVQGISYD